MVLTCSIQSIMFFIPLSFSYSISALVGAALGRGDIKRAKEVIYLVFAISFVFVLGMFFTVEINTQQIVSMYTGQENSEIDEKTAKNLQVYAYVFVLDSI